MNVLTGIRWQRSEERCQEVTWLSRYIALAGLEGIGIIQNVFLEFLQSWMNYTFMFGMFRPQIFFETQIDPGIHNLESDCLRKEKKKKVKEETCNPHVCIILYYISISLSLYIYIYIIVHMCNHFLSELYPSLLVSGCHPQK